VSARVIAAAREATDGPLLVGGGIMSVSAARQARDAGADYVVIGTLFERAPFVAVRPLASAARA
jgi:heptaprenylglyceryl phosphate synthase